MILNLDLVVGVEPMVLKMEAREVMLKAEEPKEMMGLQGSKVPTVRVAV